LQRAVLGRRPTPVAGRAPALRVARELVPKQLKRGDTHDGSSVMRYSDGARLVVAATNKDTENRITGFELKVPGESDKFTVAITDPMYGWFSDTDKDTKRAAYLKSIAPVVVQTQPAAAADHWWDYAERAGSGKTWWVPPRLVMYTQNSISWSFSEPTPGGAENVDDAIDALLGGRDKIWKMKPLRLVQIDDDVVSLDNRRLWVAKQAARRWEDEQPLLLQVRWASKREEDSQLSWKLTGEGTSIQVIGRPAKKKTAPPAASNTLAGTGKRK
jgi:hypothetical protein